MGACHPLQEPAPPATGEPWAEAVEISPSTFARLSGFVTKELGINMPASKRTLLQSRLLRRVWDLRLRSVDDYAEYLFGESGGEEREHFINAVTTNKTDFFREPVHFRYLVERVLPPLAHRGSRFNAWSAGCSSGEEPYTLSIVLAEYASRQPGFDFAILATDISTRVLESARSGIYEESRTRPIPPELRRKYLRYSRNHAERLTRIVPELRRKISFHALNFMDEDYAVKDLYDAVFFRNVMIYFDKARQEAVIRKICRNLRPGGYFFAGHSESLGGLSVPLTAVEPSIYRKTA